jgi:GTPase SAR1 family protein
MTAYSEQRLSRFVDREVEMGSFRRMLDDSDRLRPVMVIWGEGGIGKSSLLLRMMHECSLRSLIKAEIVFSTTRDQNYLEVMRKIRDDVGAIKFGLFTQLVNFFYNRDARIELVVDAKGVSVADRATISHDAQVGLIAGTVVKDNMFVMARSDLAIPESERMARLTDQFIEELDAAAADRKIVIFFDAIEKAPEVTRRWVWEELIGALRRDRLVNIRFVLGTRSQPIVEEDWSFLVEQRQLAPLKFEHIREYMIKRGIDANEATVAARWVLISTAGSPLKVASTVEEMSRIQREENRAT